MTVAYHCVAPARRPGFSTLGHLVAIGFLLAVGALFSPAISPAEAASHLLKPVAQTVAEGKGSVIGFRGAKFGMDEKAVRNAIKADFGIDQSGIEVETNPIEKTTALVIKVEDIVPDSGPCQVVYILGYKARKLIQVNIAWGAPLDPKATVD